MLEYMHEQYQWICPCHLMGNAMIKIKIKT
nr:MAG TPA: hypothetical protein [Caudoviricetes sp.]